MTCRTDYFKWTASSEYGTYRLCEQRRFRRACASAHSPEPPLLSHTSSESRGTFRQKTRSLVPLNGRAWNLSWRNARRHKFAWRGPNLAATLSCEYDASLVVTIWTAMALGIVTFMFRSVISMATTDIVHVQLLSSNISLKIKYSICEALYSSYFI